MSHKITGTILLAAVFVTQAAWSQVQPMSDVERNIQMRGRPNPQRDAQADIIKQMGDIQSEITKLQAEKHKFNSDLKTIQALAAEEKATKTLSKINKLIKTRTAQYDSKLKDLSQRLVRIKTTIANYAKRNQAENRINTVAPAFSATTVQGKKISYGQLKGKVIVLEWLHPECKFTRYAYQRGKVKELTKEYANHEDVVWLGICSTKTDKPNSMSDFVKKNKIKHPIIDDASGQIARLYYAKTTPHFVIVDKDGKIAYSGAFDNSLPKPKDGKVTGYVANAISEILQGKPVTVPSVAPVGTPIKAGRLR